MCARCDDYADESEARQESEPFADTEELERQCPNCDSVFSGLVCSGCGYNESKDTNQGSKFDTVQLEVQRGLLRG